MNSSKFADRVLDSLYSLQNEFAAAEAKGKGIIKSDNEQILLEVPTNYTYLYNNTSSNSTNPMDLQRRAASAVITAFYVGQGRKLISYFCLISSGDCTLIEYTSGSAVMKILVDMGSKGGLVLESSSSSSKSEYELVCDKIKSKLLSGVNYFVDILIFTHPDTVHFHSYWLHVRTTLVS